MHLCDGDVIHRHTLHYRTLRTHIFLSKHAPTDPHPHQTTIHIALTAPSKETPSYFHTNYQLHWLHHFYLFSYINFWFRGFFRLSSITCGAASLKYLPFVILMNLPTFIQPSIIFLAIYFLDFWKRFIDDIFFIFLGSNSQLKSLMTFMNTISPTIKYTFTYSKQTVTFLDFQIYFYEKRKLKTKLCRKPTDCMTLLHFHSHYPLSCKEGIIYSQALR